MHYAAGRTQDLNVYQQCNAGVRFFDVRIANSYISREGKKHYEFDSLIPVMRAQHGPGVGARESRTAFGEEGNKIFEGVGNFLRANPSELVFIRLSKCMPSVLEVLPGQLEGLLGPDILFKRDFECNLLDTPIGIMRGKAVVMYDGGGEDSGIVKQEKGIHQFLNVSKGSKSDAVKSIVAHGKVKGIASCGAYSSGQNFQDVMGDLADCATGFDKFKKTGTGNQTTHWGLHVKGDCGCGNTPHLFMLYWTYTSKNPLNNVAKRTASENAKTEGVTAELGKVMAQFDRGLSEKHMQPSYSAGDLDSRVLLNQDPNYAQLRANITRKYLDSQTAKARCMPNVVMYDFANVQTSTEIINLNHRDILDECTRVSFEGGQKSQVFYSQGFLIPME